MVPPQQHPYDVFFHCLGLMGVPVAAVVHAAVQEVPAAVVQEVPAAVVQEVPAAVKGVAPIAAVTALTKKL